MSFLSSAKVDYDTVVLQAITKLDSIENDHWSFKHVRTSGDEITSSYFDPRRAVSQQWQLLLVNGAVPTVEEIDEFNQIWNQSSSKEDIVEEEATALSSMIKTESLMLDRTKDGLAYYHFSPLLEDMKNESDKLIGDLILDVEKQQIVSLTITNHEPLSPAFSVTLESFSMGFEFAQIDQKLVYRRIVMNMSGTAGFVKDISQNTTEEFLEYYYVGPPA